MTVLIIEDDVDIRDSLKDVLEMESMRTLLAGDGQQGLDVLRAGHKIDLILLDMMMPVMNGWQFLDALKAQPEWAGIPVIAISAASGTSQVRADAFMHKPLDVSVLLDTIRSLCAAGKIISAG